MALAERGIDGAVVLITGGASGIGLATAHRLAELGAKVVVADRDVEGGEAVAKAVDGTFVRCDVTRPEDSVAAVTAAEQTHGRLDLALLNAGIQGGGLLEPFDMDAYRRVMAVNADGVAFGLVAALPALVRSRGTAVCTASLAGLTGIPADPPYAMSKHAVVGLVRSAAPTYAERGVVVNAVCPGFTDTPLVADIKDLISTGYGVPLIEPDAVVDGVIAAALSPNAGECWIVQVGREPLAYGFRGIPGPRTS
ncbi:MAG TPA: SDR family oxidoreductase [Mycobacteriales bacterium]|nr:SDR family oxidoreductase [Mycobacteriales bacterium]